MNERPSNHASDHWLSMISQASDWFAGPLGQQLLAQRLRRVVPQHAVEGRPRLVGGVLLERVAAVAALEVDAQGSRPPAGPRRRANHLRRRGEEVRENGVQDRLDV